jgi:hypothetical protein
MNSEGPGFEAMRLDLVCQASGLLNQDRWPGLIRECESLFD